MIVKNPKFEISAVKPSQYPHNDLPQIVLVGKSNVGKSSFINTMLNRKKLARTSSEPGKTRQINFYNVDEKFYFVDLPDFGLCFGLVFRCGFDIDDCVLFGVAPTSTFDISAVVDFA